MNILKRVANKLRSPARIQYQAPSGHQETIGADAELIRKWQLFNVETYRFHSADLQAMSDTELYRHFVEYGMWEGRTFLEPSHVARTFASIDVEGFQPDADNKPASPNFKVALLVSSAGNSFMREIAGDLSDQLEAAGVGCIIGDQTMDPNSVADRMPIVVAPHEFFTLGDGVKWGNIDFIRRAVMVSTEQPQTKWFGLSVPYLINSKAIIELCYQSASAFQNAGKSSYFHIPAYRDQAEELPTSDDEIFRSPLIQALPGAALKYDTTGDTFSSRPIDIAFFGTDSIHRDLFFAAATPHLARMRQVILYRRLHASPNPYGTPAEVARINNFILQRTRILINVHRDPLGYFEIHRMGIMGFLNKALVVSDPCFKHPVFKPGEHYLEETFARIPKLIDWLIHTTEGQDLAEAVRTKAYQAYCQQLSIKQQAEKLVTFLNSLR